MQNILSAHLCVAVLNGHLSIAELFGHLGITDLCLFVILWWNLRSLTGYELIDSEYNTNSSVALNLPCLSNETELLILEKEGRSRECGRTCNKQWLFRGQVSEKKIRFWSYRFFLYFHSDVSLFGSSFFPHLYFSRCRPPSEQQPEFHPFARRHDHVFPCLCSGHCFGCSAY